MRKLIIRVLYADINGLSRSEVNLHMLNADKLLKKGNDELPSDIKENYYIQDIILPTKRQTKMEILYPSIFEYDDLSQEEIDKLIVKLQEFRNNLKK